MSDTRETDTSTEAVEAHAKTAERALLPETATLLRTLLRERNEARRERDEALQAKRELALQALADEGQYQENYEARLKAEAERDAAFETCAKVARTCLTDDRLMADVVSSAILSAAKARQEG